MLRYLVKTASDNRVGVAPPVISTDRREWRNLRFPMISEKKDLFTKVNAFTSSGLDKLEMTNRMKIINY